MHSLFRLLRSLLLALQTLHLGSALSPSLALPPRKPSVATVIRLGRDASLFSSATNQPVGLTVHISRAQLRARLGIHSLDTRHTGPVLINRSDQVRLERNRIDARDIGHIQLPATGRVARDRELPFLLENDPNIPATGVSLGIEVVPDIAGLRGVDGVVTAHGAVLAGKPFRPPLPENDASRHDVLAACALCAEALAGWIARVPVGRSL